MSNLKKVPKAMFEVDTTYDGNIVKTNLYPNKSIIDEFTEQTSTWIADSSDEVIVKALVNNNYTAAIRLRNVLDKHLKLKGF